MGGFFDHYRYATGEPIRFAGAGNVLVRRAVFDAVGHGFDERLGLTGGEDHHFFRRVHRAGFRMVWADDAVVCEWIPPVRATARWMLRRFYRQGTTNSFCHLDLARGPLTRLTLAGRGCGWVVAGLVLLPLGAILGRHKWMKYLRCVYYGVGLLAGVFGRRVEEYRQTPTQ
jgi:hypothetical protein